ncbi:MAG TPA: efflux RND transporter periplasmic adaptor subunit [Polyangiaceae bacterium]|nr:efflux RND transporter periplasmic adaptor subunit [Polyangiaceae bacterium]
MTHSGLIPPSSEHVATQLTLVTLPRSGNANRRRVAWLTASLLALGLAFCATVGQGSKALHSVASAPQPEVDGKRIVFPAEYAKRIALETVEIAPKKVVPAFSVVGLATFDPAHVVRVGARLRGVVRDVYHYEGESVRAGEALAAIDSPELGQAQAAVSVLVAENGAAERNRVREEALAERQLTTKRYLEEAVAGADRSKALLSAAQHRVAALAGVSSTKNQRRLGVHVLSSPLTGTLIERRVAKGQLVEADHAAFLVANLDHLWVELLVFERHLAAIKVGDAVELHAENHGPPDIVLGKIAHLGVVLDADTRGATVRVYVDNTARKFRPGQSVNAVIRATAAAVDDIPTVPGSAVVYVDGEPSVFIADGPHSVIVTKVELGETNGHEVQIKDGVETGQRVVTRGTTELRNQLFR